LLKSCLTTAVVFLHFSGTSVDFSKNKKAKVIL